MSEQLPLWPEPAGVESGATFSPCGLYRYHLWRRWGDGPTVNFIMLNPSTADAAADDPTVRRCVAFARSWGHGTLAVTNLYALRATDPRELWKAADPVGPDNDAFLLAFAARADLVVCAWGNGGSPGWAGGPTHRGRGPVVRHLLARAGVKPHCLRTTSRCQPAHPLYLPADLRPVPFDVEIEEESEGEGGATR